MIFFKKIIFIFCYLFFNNLFAQRVEIQTSYSLLNDFSLKNSNWLWIESKFNYKPTNAFFFVTTGVEYLKNNKNSHNITIKRIIFPLSLNFTVGKSYIIYGGYGLYACYNISQKKIDNLKPTLFLLGHKINLGFQYKLNHKTKFNFESKFLQDGKDSFKDIIPPCPGCGYREDILNFISLNIGFSYILKNK